jgi:hypothetical protein
MAVLLSNLHISCCFLLGVQESVHVYIYKLCFFVFSDTEAMTYFSLDAVTGNITAIKNLDYEDKNRTPGERFLLEIRV